VNQDKDKADPIVKDGPGKAPAADDTQAAPSTEKVAGRPQNEPPKPEEAVDGARH
jgi:hypothetical protein